MNTKIIRIAFNNVIKQKRRAVLNALTFSANMMALVTLLGLVRGVYNYMIDQTIDLSSGHLVIYTRDYLKEKPKMPLDKAIKEPEKLIDALRNVPHFKAAAARILKNITLSDRRNKTNVIVCGVNMQEEKSISSALNNVKGGLPGKNGDGIVLGKRLAGMMKDKPGDNMLVFGQTRYKANNLVDVSVSGVYSAGFDYLEKYTVFMDIDFAAKFFDMEGFATQILIKLDDKVYVGEAKERIASILKRDFPELVVRDWIEESPELMAGLANDIVTYMIMFCILLFMAIFIIINTLTMSVYERTAEIGTLRAIGLEKGQIRAMFFWEGMILSFLGVIAGGLLVLPIVYQLNVHGIPTGGMGAQDVPIPIGNSMNSMNRVTDWLICGLICMIAGAIGSIIPSNRAAETNIVDALKKGVR